MTDEEKGPFWAGRIAFGLAALPLLALAALAQSGRPASTDLWVLGAIALVSWVAAAYVARRFFLWPFRRS